MISKPALVLTLAGALAFGACSKNANLPAAACPPCEAQKSANADQVVATYANHKVTMGELDEMIAKDVFEMRRQALEAMIISKLVEEKAKAAGKDPETFLRGIAEQSVAAPIPEEQLKAMYERAKPQLGDKSFEEVKPMIEGMMKQEAQKKAMIDYIDQLRKEANVQILLEEPKVVRDPGCGYRHLRHRPALRPEWLRGADPDPQGHHRGRRALRRHQHPRRLRRGRRHQPWSLHRRPCHR